MFSGHRGFGLRPSYNVTLPLPYLRARTGLISEHETYVKISPGRARRRGRPYPRSKLYTECKA